MGKQALASLVMLVLSLFIVLAAVALPTVYSTSALHTRTVSLCLLAAALLAFNGLGTSAYLFNDLMRVTPVALSVDSLVLIAGAVALQPWAPMTPFPSPRTAHPTVGTYPLFVLFTTIGATCLIAATDLVTLYLAIELQSFAVYVIATVLNRDSESATQSGLLYFMLGGLSSTLVLLGSALVYQDTGHTNLSDVIAVLQVTATGDVANGLGQTALGFTLIAVGCLFKISAAPFHNWAPDVYDGVPTAAATWLAVLPKVSLLGLLLVLQTGLGGGTLQVTIGSGQYDSWTGLLVLSSVLSLVVGTVVGLAQVRIKRLLAYSTVSHVGFLLLALASHSQEAVEAYLFYVIVYTATALLSFLTVQALGYVLYASAGASRDTLDVSRVSELSGLFTTNPLLAAPLAVALFSMAGVPPLAGFYAKQGVLYAALHSGYVFVSVVAVVASVVSASYYLRVVRVVHFDTLASTPSPQGGNKSMTAVPVTALHSYVLALLTTALVAFMASPDILFDSTRLLALTLYSA